MDGRTHGRVSGNSDLDFVINEFNPTSESQNIGNGAFQNASFANAPFVNGCFPNGDYSCLWDI